MFCEIYIALKNKSYRFYISTRIFYLEHSYKMIIMKIDQNIEYSDKMFCHYYAIHEFRIFF